MRNRKNGLRQEDHDPEQLRAILDTAKRMELASFSGVALRNRNGNLRSHSRHGDHHNAHQTRQLRMRFGVGFGRRPASNSAAALELC
jgi:hypothetical protein